ENDIWFRIACRGLHFRQVSKLESKEPERACQVFLCVVVQSTGGAVKNHLKDRQREGFTLLNASRNYETETVRRWPGSPSNLTQLFAERVLDFASFIAQFGDFPRQVTAIGSIKK